MSNEAALLKAIVANPGEDTPRLAFADWLDEHDQPDRAEFIRVQVALAAGTPGDPDYPDLLERWEEVAARVSQFQWEPEWPPGVKFYGPMHNREDEEWRRGFPEVVQVEAAIRAPTPADIDKFRKSLPALVATTTARGLELHDVPAADVERVLNSPGAEAITGLTVMASGYEEGSGDAVARATVAAPCAPNLERLTLYSSLSGDGLAALAKSDALRRLAYLHLPVIFAGAAEIARLVAAPWFRRLRCVSARAMSAAEAAKFVAGLAKLPDLHTAVFQEFPPAGVKAFGAAKGFPRLGRLVLAGRVQGLDPSEAALAKAKFPALAVLELSGTDMRNDGFAKLLAAKWAGQLRVLNLIRNGIGDKGIAALAASPAAGGLRILKIGENPFGKSGLAALGSGAFPNLTTLDIGSSTKRKAAAADLAKFLASPGLPRVRHLILDEWPLGDAGAKALAANPASANLTRLGLSRCAIGSAGADALVRSPHLQNLVELNIDSNAITDLPALADPKNLPRLATCRIYGNKIPKAKGDKLSAARPDVL